MARMAVGNHKAALWVVGAVLAGGAYFFQVHAEQDRATCQAEYNQAFATQLKERSRISTASDKAQTDLIAGVSKLILAPPTKDTKVLDKRGKAYRNLFIKFNNVVEQVEQDRAANPLPEIPNC